MGYIQSSIFIAINFFAFITTLNISGEVERVQNMIKTIDVNIHNPRYPYDTALIRACDLGNLFCSFLYCFDIDFNQGTSSATAVVVTI